MTNFKFQSILFVSILIGLVLFVKVDQGESKKETFSKNVNETSVGSLTNYSAQMVSVVAQQQEVGSSNQIKSKLTAAEFSEEKEIKIDSNINSLNLSAKIFCASDLVNNKEILGNNDRNRWPIASITKLMSAIIASEKMNSDSKIKISPEADSIESSSEELLVGETYSIKDLTKAMLVISSNEAAEAIAEFYGRKKFVDELQKKAAELGMFNTTFFDPTGLSFLNQSNCQDLKKLILYILNTHQEFLDITAQKNVELTLVGFDKLKTLKNINSFAGNKDFIGGKTGFTDISGGNLISIFKNNNSKFLVIVLGSNDRFGDSQAIWNFINK